ncbi:MAG TPA: histone deacetylase [Planctomycetota bacterium]|nr:histone deacetylase [Planctomycetota bacterium]
MKRRDFITLAGSGVAVAALAEEKPMAQKTALISDAIYKDHDTGGGHPERPARYDAVIGALKKAGLEEKLEKIDPRDATEAEITAVHTGEYFKTAKRDIKAGANVLSTGDTNVSEKSFEIALRAAGGVLNAVDAVMSSKVRNAFCVVRPPGHHATPNRGMGFCVFNNIAVGARYAQQKHKIGKVLIVDWDVHHGNGTQDIFYEDDTVYFMSSHQSPWYPGTGKLGETGTGKGLGFTLNCPFPAGSGRKQILEEAFQDKLGTAMKTFKPELVMISAGFDSRIDDPLGKFTLTDEDFTDLTKYMLALAKEYAGSRVVSVLEGGYNLQGLGNAAAAHVNALLNG